MNETSTEIVAVADSDGAVDNDPCPLPAVPGSRLHFSWGTGNQLRLVEVCCPSTGVGGEDPFAAMHSWKALEPEDRRIAYDIMPLYKQLRKDLQRLGPMCQTEARQAIKAYSRDVMAILTLDASDDGAIPPEALPLAYAAGLWQLLDLFFLGDDATEGFFAEAFAAWLGQHGSLFCSTPGVNQLLSEAQRLLQAARLDQDPAYWPVLQRLVLTGQLELAVQLLTAHPAYQAMEEPDMAAQVEALDQVYQLLRTVPRFSSDAGSSSGRLAATGILFDRPAEFAAQRLAWEQRVEQVWANRDELLGDLRKLDPAAAMGLSGVICMLLARSSNAALSRTSYNIMAGVAHNWVELLAGLLLWKFVTLRLLNLRQVVVRMCSPEGLVTRESDHDFLDFFQQLLLAACDQEVQSVVSLCSNSPYSTLQFLVHVYEVLRGLPGAERVICRPLAQLGGDQAEFYTLSYAEALMAQASTWQLAAEYLAWCPVHGSEMLEALLARSPFPLQDERSALKALALAQRHGLTAAAQGLCRRLGLAAAQSGRLPAALQWMLRARDAARCAELVAPLLQKVQHLLLEQVAKHAYLIAPLDLPELQDLEPLLLHLPPQPGSSLYLRGSARPAQVPQARPFQELHCLAALLQLQKGLQGLQLCQQQCQEQQQRGQGTELQQQAALAAVHAALRQPVLDLLLGGLAPAAMQLPLLVYLVPLLDSLYTPFSNSDVRGLMQVLGTAAGAAPAAAAVLAGTDGAGLGLGWPLGAVDAGQGAVLVRRHVNDVRLALCRALARSHVAESLPFVAA